jgi:RND family efflux transporter MFP subunit
MEGGMGSGRNTTLAGRISLMSASLLTIIALHGCAPEASAPAREPLQVVVQPARYTDYKRSVSLTGVIRPRTESALAFRTAGRMTARNADVGDHVKAGDILAEIDASEQQAGLKAADASLQAANAVLTQAQLSYDRMKTLLAQGISTRKQFDAANESLSRALQSVQSAEAQRGTALDDLAATKLKAPANGIITTRDGEPGQVVQAAQTVFKMAEDGPRDAVFNLYESILADPPPQNQIDLSLVTDPSVKATAKVREVSPTVDQSTGTVEAKLVLENTPPQMKLGSSVVGTAYLRPVRAIVLPWTAMFSLNGVPAVWVVDPKSSVVSLKKVDLFQYDAEVIVLSKGLDDGELVVTEGGKLLRRGQVVKYLQEATQ